VTPEARAALDALDDVLSKTDNTSREVWQVIAAMRGPDGRQGPLDITFHNVVKLNVTVPLRRAAFPKTAAKYDGSQGYGAYAVWLGATFGDVYDPNGLRKNVDLDSAKRQSNHFAAHAQEAAKTLGLPVLNADPNLEY